MASSSDKREPKAGAEPVTVPAGSPPSDRFAAHQELRIGEIVLAAAALEPAEREDYLRQVTVSEPGLLEEARHRLHQATALPTAFLAVPAAELVRALYAFVVVEPIFRSIAEVGNGLRTA